MLLRFKLGQSLRLVEVLCWNNSPGLQAQFGYNSDMFMFSPGICYA